MIKHSDAVFLCNTCKLADAFNCFVKNVFSGFFFNNGLFKSKTAMSVVVHDVVAESEVCRDGAYKLSLCELYSTEDTCKVCSVYIFVNGKMKANITSSDLKSFKVKKGDAFIVKGHSLTGTATVTIESAVGNIDTSIVGTSVTVGNLGKYLVKIE